MSTSYMLRTPLTKGQVTRALPGWRFTTNGATTGECLTDGSTFVWPYFEDRPIEGGKVATFVMGFERFGANDPGEVTDVIDCVSEHDDSDPDYEQLFPLCDD